MFCDIHLWVTFTASAQAMILYDEFENYTFKIIANELHNTPLKILLLYGQLDHWIHDELFNRSCSGQA